jgi:DNA uptake protein ComE-like DNA-binding protein
MKKILKDYFSFNSRERVSILLLCCFMAFFWILPYGYPETKTIAVSNNWVSTSIDSPKALANELNKSLGKTNTDNEVKPFEFDPNELPAKGWEKLGLRQKTIQTILHYREKGGRFWEAGDLKKIWGISERELNLLIPYVVIAKNDKPIDRLTLKIPKSIPASILINQATAADLLLIPGFTKPLAARMIKFRDKIGGFQNLDQIKKTYGLSDSLFQLIAPKIVLSNFE